MPLRDHFRPPISKRSSCEGIHGLWPAAMVQELVRTLPANYVAEPRVHLGSFFEIDVCAFEDETALDSPKVPHEGNGGIATAKWAPPVPTLAVDVDLPEQYAYELLVFDLDRGRRLVAAVEIVSPANKDRPDSRQICVAKCAGLLLKGVCVSLVDLVTVGHFNLYTDLLALLNRSDPAMSPDPPAIYAATCLKPIIEQETRLETWASPLAIGQPLPILPIWLTENEAVSLDLEAAYENACQVLRIV
jgi:hypothetical protein